MSKDKSTPKISDIFSAKTNDTPQSNQKKKKKKEHPVH